MWLVDTDGRGMCAVADEMDGRSVRLFEGTREACEGFISSARTAPPKRRGRPKGSKNADKVSAPFRTETPAETVTVAPKKVLEVAEDNALYAQGCYREPCRVCGNGIPRTGKRGRAPIYHDHCRPRESE